MPASRPPVGPADERTAVRDGFRGRTAGTRDRVRAGPALRRVTRSWLLDMDGVPAREEHAIPGAARLLLPLRELRPPFPVLIHNSMYARRAFSARLRIEGLEVPQDAIWTSALATAPFLEDQCPGGSTCAVGEAGVTTALYQAGYMMSDRERDYALRRQAQPADDAVGPQPARRPFLEHDDPGDRTDTDVVTGLKAGLETIVVLSGVTARGEAGRVPSRTSRIVDSVADLVDGLGP